MEVIAPYANWLGTFVAQVAQPILQAGVKSATPVAPVAMVSPAASASPVSLGLKILLEPNTGGFIFRAASNTVATIYPVYASAKAIESKDTRDDVQWLTYWTLYGSLILAEHLADQALGKIPYYYHAKFAALLWLQLPQTRGAEYLYTRYYKPALAKFGPRIDTVLDKGKAVLETVYATYKVPIDATCALLLELFKRLERGVAWLITDVACASKKDGDGEAKANAA